MTFICRGSLDYGYEAVLQTLSPEAYAQFQSRLPQRLPVERPEMFDWNFSRDMFMDVEEVEAWNSIGVDVTMSRVKGLASTSRSPQQTIYQISVANVGLMQVRRVQVLEDCCTDELQSCLNDGWRILAVCPPNDARRPSYVLGHFEQQEK